MSKSLTRPVVYSVFQREPAICTPKVLFLEPKWKRTRVRRVKKCASTIEMQYVLASLPNRFSFLKILSSFKIWTEVKAVLRTDDFNNYHSYHHTSIDNPLLKFNSPIQFRKNECQTVLSIDVKQLQLNCTSSLSNTWIFFAH